MFIGVMVILALSLGNLLLQYWAEVTRTGSINRLTGAQRAALIAQDLEEQLSAVQAMHEGLVELGSDATNEEVEVLVDEVDRLQVLFQELDGLGALLAKEDSASSGVIKSLVGHGQQLVNGWQVYALAKMSGADATAAMIAHATEVRPAQSQVASDLETLLSSAAVMQQSAQSHYEDVTDLTRQTSALIFTGSTAIIVILVLLFSRNLTRRLGTLRAGAEKIGEGVLGHRIEEKHSDELGQLAESFNDMSSRLSEARNELTGANEALAEQYEESNQQREKAQDLLLNILPASTAEELTARGSVTPYYYKDATVIFGDISGFTLSSEKLAADELVELLHQYFTAFDRIVDRYGVEKLKTIGDCYMAVGGVPESRESHAVDAVLACMELKHAVDQLNADGSGPGWKLRIGLHSGPVIAGVVGIRKFAFDIWGSTVNLAARMESSGEPGQINISEATLINVKDFFEVESRGAIMTKDKREVPMYFVTGVQSKLLEGEGEIPEAFRRRYEVYFRRQPPAFPPFLCNRAGKQADERPSRSTA